MAVLHISEEEAVNDFRAVLGHLDQGDDIVIERERGAVRLFTASPARPLTFREAIAVLNSRSNTYSGDETFADDIEDAMNRMRAVPDRPSPWG